MHHTGVKPQYHGQSSNKSFLGLAKGSYEDDMINQLSSHCEEEEIGSDSATRYWQQGGLRVTPVRGGLTGKPTYSNDIVIDTQ